MVPRFLTLLVSKVHVYSPVLRAAHRPLYEPSRVYEIASSQKGIKANSQYSNSVFVHVA
jgi:hypothetical protein